jgi:Ni,Fe-hydrogenase III large subunit/Ni,Fe-hydrogenase III component G
MATVERVQRATAAAAPGTAAPPDAAPAPADDALGAHVATRLRERLGPLAAVRHATRGRVDAVVVPASVPAAARVVFEDLGARYVISVGSDRRAAGLGFEAMHCFAFDRDATRLTLRAALDPDRPAVPSIAPLIPGAAWAEREMLDMLGIVPEGHPDPGRLVLPSGFPAGVHPLRKDVPHDLAWDEGAGPADPPRPAPHGTTELVLGPFFPVLEEPSQWRLFVDGERVVGAEYRGFFCHRAIEKLGDSVLGWNAVISLAERICGICGCVHSTSYCQAVEEAAGLEVPLRAKVIRTLVLELERVQSHLLWLGLAGHVVGFDWLFMHAWRLREPLMDLAERMTGSRKHFSVNLVGGTRFDVPRALHPAVTACLDEVAREATALARVLEGDDALVSRLAGVGVLTPDEARATGAVGPTARASGLPIDVRRDHPYAAYGLVRFDVAVEQGCDVLARTRVRVREMFESVSILRQCLALLDDLPEGGVMAEVPERLPAGREGQGAVEAPRGEVHHFLRTGERHGPERWRVRAPSYQNLQAVPLMFKDGTQVADVPIALASIDPCFSCTERVELVDAVDGSRVLGQADFEAISRLDMARRRAARAGRRTP